MHKINNLQFFEWKNHVTLDTSVFLVIERWFTPSKNRGGLEYSARLCAFRRMPATPKP